MEQSSVRPGRPGHGGGATHAAVETAIEPCTGWHCSHLFYAFDRARVAAGSPIARRHDPAKGGKGSPIAPRHSRGLAVQASSAVVAGSGSGLDDATVTGDNDSNVRQIARSLFGDYVFAFELVSVLLVVAVVATVLLSRRPDKTGGPR
jgi:hypothetical protein